MEILHLSWPAEHPFQSLCFLLFRASVLNSLLTDARCFSSGRYLFSSLGERESKALVICLEPRIVFETSSNFSWYVLLFPHFQYIFSLEFWSYLVGMLFCIA